MAQSDLSQQQQDEALLQKFGYKQELRRSLGFISNFAVAFFPSGAVRWVHCRRDR